MKDTIIAINDFTAYVVVAVITLFGLVSGWGAGNAFLGLIGAGVGLVIGSLVAGFWFVLSGIYTELKAIRQSGGKLG